MWYQTPAVWVASAAVAILAVLLIAVWVALNLGLERGERRAADRYRARVTEAERDAYAAWQARGRPPVYTVSTLGYPDAIQAMPAADTEPLGLLDNSAGQWHYPRLRESPGLLPETDEEPPTNA
jgi:hypothetical protein